MFNSQFYFLKYLFTQILIGRLFDYNHVTIATARWRRFTHAHSQPDARRLPVLAPTRLCKIKRLNALRAAFLPRLLRKSIYVVSRRLSTRVEHFYYHKINYIFITFKNIKASKTKLVGNLILLLVSLCYLLRIYNTFIMIKYRHFAEIIFHCTTYFLEHFHLNKVQGA